MGMEDERNEKTERKGMILTEWGQTEGKKSIRDGDMNE
jgi:hypothetical protein